MKRSRIPAFTLIEVLVVVAIVALLVAILLPSLTKARDQAQALVCKTRLEQLYKGHALYGQDNKTHFPDPDWWLWDGIGGEMRNHFPALYTKTGNVRPTDSSRWVEFGHIFKYVRDKEVYFCPKDTKRRSGNSIGGASGGGPADRGSKPINSFVRIIHPHHYYSDHIGAAADLISNAPRPDMYRSDFLKPDQLRPGAFWPVGGNASTPRFNSTPNRVGLLYEEWQTADDNRNAVGTNSENQLNDGYSGFTRLRLLSSGDYVDWISTRHFQRSHILYWDGHMSLVDAKKFNEPTNSREYARYVGLGLIR